MSIAEALSLVILLLTRIQVARQAGLETIEVDDLGVDFDAVNAKIQAARDLEP